MVISYDTAPEQSVEWSIASKWPDIFFTNFINL